MSAHTKEPWEVHHAKHCRDEYWASIGANGRGPITDIIGEEGNPAKYYIPVAGMQYLVTPVAEQKANAKRIVDCVNACQGIENPAAIPEAIEALKEAHHWHTAKRGEGRMECRDMERKMTRALDALNGRR